MKFYRFALHNKNNNSYSFSMYDKSFFSAFIWYKDKVFSKKDSFYSLYADSFDIVVVGLYDSDFDKYLGLESPLSVYSLGELRNKAITIEECTTIEKDMRIEMFMIATYSLLRSLVFRPKYDILNS